MTRTAIWPCPAWPPEEPIGGLQRDLDETTVREDSGVVAGYEFAGTGSLASRLWTKPSVTVIGFDAHPVEGSFNVIAPETRFRLSLRTAPTQRPEEAQEALGCIPRIPRAVRCQGHCRTRRKRHGLGHGPDRRGHQGRAGSHDRGRSAWSPSTRARAAPSRSSPNCSASSPTAQVLVTGPEDPKANAHSPNESISLPGLKNNVITEALLLDKLGK